MIRLAGLLVAALALLGVALSGCKSGGAASGSATSASACAGCSKMKSAGTGWCDSCSKGVVKGESVACWGCYVGKTGGNECARHKARK